jgi:hypothetical protein
MRAGARRYPELPFPKQHQPKPGHEYKLDPEPLYDAPHYLGSKKLEGKVAIVTGGDSGMGRSVAVLYAREGADISIVYLEEDEDAKRTRESREGRTKMPVNRRRRYRSEILCARRSRDPEGVRPPRHSRQLLSSSPHQAAPVTLPARSRADRIAGHRV